MARGAALWGRAVLLQPGTPWGINRGASPHHSPGHGPSAQTPGTTSAPKVSQEATSLLRFVARAVFH